MAICFVLIKVEPHKDYIVFNKLAKINKVVELHPLFGQFDLIVKLEVDDIDQLEDIVLNKIRVLEGVANTETLTGIKPKADKES